MTKRGALFYAAVMTALAGLVYLQFRSWTDFDWGAFRSQWTHLKLRHILVAIVLVYVSYVLRALRWKILMRSAFKKASIIGLLAPTLIGFTGLALLGRAGDLIRPYLIARRYKLTFSSQMAVWTVERIFDIGGFTVLLLAAIFFPTDLRTLANPDIYPRLQLGGVVLTALVAVSALVIVVIAKFGNLVADGIEKHFLHKAPKYMDRLAQFVREFQYGLDTIDGPRSFVELSLISSLMWWVIACAFRETAHAYGAPLQEISVSNALVLLGASMLGSLIQLPAVGGGVQLAAISTLQTVFDARPELAAGCGIMLWLVTSMSVVPAGLLLAHREHLSLRKLSEQSAEEVVNAAPPS